MQHLALFIQHSIAHFKRERQRALFTLFCVAAGVAAVVALRTQGLTIETDLTQDLRAANRGDMVVRTPPALDDQEAAADPSLFDVQGSGIVHNSVTPYGVQCRARKALERLTL